MPSSLVSTTAGRPVLPTAPATSGALAASIGRTGYPDREGHRLEPGEPATGQHHRGGGRRTEQHRRPLHRLRRHAERLGQPVLDQRIQCALADLVEHQAAQQVLLRLGGLREQGLDGRGPQRRRTLAAEGGDLLERRVDVVTVSVDPLPAAGSRSARPSRPRSAVAAASRTGR